MTVEKKPTGTSGVQGAVPLPLSDARVELMKKRDGYIRLAKAIDAVLDALDKQTRTVPDGLV